MACGGPAKGGSPMLEDMIGAARAVQKALDAAVRQP
jgi:hypothetical protein